MTVNRTKPKSILSTACFYAAGYCCLAALLVFVSQALYWYREGVWASFRLWLILDWVGWQHAPRSPVPRLQPWLDQAWDMLSECPITIAFSIATVAIAVLGFAQELALARVIERGGER
jgi:hypothetical protein